MHNASNLSVKIILTDMLKHSDRTGVALTTRATHILEDANLLHLLKLNLES